MILFVCFVNTYYVILHSYMNIFETISLHRSVRNFDGCAISDSQAKQIRQSIQHASSPFGGNYTIKLVNVDDVDEFKPSTYGVIKELNLIYYSVLMCPTRVRGYRVVMRLSRLCLI